MTPSLSLCPMEELCNLLVIKHHNKIFHFPFPNWFIMARWCARQKDPITQPVDNVDKVLVEFLKLFCINQFDPRDEGGASQSGTSYQQIWLRMGDWWGYLSLSWFLLDLYQLTLKISKNTKTVIAPNRTLPVNQSNQSWILFLLPQLSRQVKQNFKSYIIYIIYTISGKCIYIVILK